TGAAIGDFTLCESNCQGVCNSTTIGPIVDDGAKGAIVVTTPSTQTGNFQVSRVDISGNVLWSTRVYFPNTTLTPTAAIPNPGGGIIVVGRAITATSGTFGFFAVLNGSGAMQAASSLFGRTAGASASTDYFFDIKPGHSGTYVMAGTATDSGAQDADA